MVAPRDAHLMITDSSHVVSERWLTVNRALSYVLGAMLRATRRARRAKTGINDGKERVIHRHPIGELVGQALELR